LRSQQETVKPRLLLETKFYPPRSPRDLVLRPRLRDSLVRGTTAKLILVSAPAGFGKSTVLAQWLDAWLEAEPAADAAEHAAAWLSLDRDDNEPASFWTYVIVALRTAVPGIGGSALGLLEAPHPTLIQTVLTMLLNDLGALERDVVLVLDDYHVIESREVHEGMAFLIDHMPPRLHLVIASRADPALPLARLRARGDLAETRAAELRFTLDEAVAYLNGLMGLRLTAGDVAVLEGRTEGWIAALQLAALSMQGRDDKAGFIAGFAGDDRYILDFLVEEVLQRQPARIQTFLLQTSILGRLSGPLCDAVTGQRDGKAMLEMLDRGNLFLVPLDDRRRWYRYHHLFADVLHARLLDEQPGDLPELRRRASVWHEQNGDLSEAIRHALAGEDFDRAADLVERAWPAMRRFRQESTMLGWLKALPDPLLGRRPVLSVTYAAVLVVSGQFEDVERRLRDAERWLEPTAAGDDGPTAPPAAMAVADEDELRRLPAAIAGYRAAQALAAGDVPGTMTHAQRALDLATSDDHLERAAAAALLGLAHWRTGDLETAHRMYADCRANLQHAGHIADAFGCTIALADIRITQGRLRDATSTYERALQLSVAQSGPVLRGTADMHVGRSELYREQGDLSGAMQHLLTAQELGEHAGLPQNPYRWRVAMARVREAQGDLDGALELLDEAESLYVGDFFPNVRPIPALRARVWAAQGRLAEVFGWAREQGLSGEGDLTYLHEFEHITLARTLLAEYRSERAGHSGRHAIALLDRLLHAAEEGDRAGSVIEILVLLAVAHQTRGDIAAALVALQRALALAEPEGYVRVFLDEGLPMAALLQAAAESGIATRYVRLLRPALSETDARPAATAGLIEPLSDRELDVLRLLATELGGPDIASELYVSLNTLRTHTKNIYAKLGVNNRRAAVRRAQELDLLRPPQRRPGPVTRER
jgi:LuxR family transcriptional regulator, maltose regulon positive regulatory protein